MFANLSSCFNSIADVYDELDILRAVDGDLHLATSRIAGDNARRNADVRLRMWNGGGKNPLLREILMDMVKPAYHPQQANFFAYLNPFSLPNECKDFVFPCDDNPGSHLKLILSNEFFGLQTNCHDEEKDRAACGYLSRQGEGPIVWLRNEDHSQVHRRLVDVLLKEKNPDPILYGQPPYSLLNFEAA